MSPTGISSGPRVILSPRKSLLLICAAFGIFANVSARAQLPYINAGPDSAFAQIDFAQMYLDQQNRAAKKSEQRGIEDKKLIDSGIVSALDLAAPNKAVQEFNHASNLFKAQNSKEATKYLQKAIQAYPKFVTAHVVLGLAYLDQGDPAAKSEFETAAKLDPRFAAPLLNLGLLALSQKDFANAQSELEKAAYLSPNNPKILSALAFAQNGDHQFSETLKTVHRVHSLEHRGMANIHYLAAAAAVALDDPDTVQQELTLFLSEDPTNAMAPIARKNLQILARRKNGPILAARITGTTESGTAGTASDSRPLQTFPNGERLEAQLNTVKDEPGSTCEVCAPAGSTDGNTENKHEPAMAAPGWTVRSVVDETALFFSVSNHGHMVSGLDLSNIQVRDDDKPPERVLQFIPQSKLPLRLGLLIDTSGSVQDRFSFEKRAATRFLQRILNGPSDLGFVAGFNSETTVTQDFTAVPAELGAGVEHLSNGGGTALFDAVSSACWKLGAYPDNERVAKVLVILSDGEDNSSHRSLKQSVQDAEASGVTIYTLSTREDAGPRTDADKILEILAERSGGEAMFPGDILALEKSLDRMRDLIRSRYLIDYRPAGFEPNGHYRTIHITAEKDGKHLQIHARKGYYARIESPAN